MYKVKLHPKKCLFGGWMKEQKEGEIHTVDEHTYKWHKGHGCMKVISHYRIVRIQNSKCKHCGSVQRETVKIPWIEYDILKKIIDDNWRYK